MACCIFKGCFKKPMPFGTVIFFNLPKDEPRRGHWLKQSGNEEVQNLPASARRLVCENHFEERWLRRQFHRTTLSRDAVPMDYRWRKGDASENVKEEVKEELLIKEKRDKTNEGDALSTDQDEILLVSSDVESDYEVLVEEMPCEEGEPPMLEVTEDYETLLVDDEEVSEEHVVTDGNVTDDAHPQESVELVEAFMIDDEASCEGEIKNADHKSLEDAGDVNVLEDTSARISQTEDSVKLENDTDEKPQESRVEEVESNDTHTQVSNSKQRNVIVYKAKHKLPTNVVSSQPAKRIKHEEVVEPDTSTVSVTSVPAREATIPPAGEQPSTSSVTAAPAAPPGKISEEEYFALSLVGPLQRLPPEKRAIAKMKILTYLVQLECGLQDANL